MFLSETHSNDDSLQIAGYKAINVCFQKKSGKRGKTPYGISVFIKQHIFKYVSVVKVTEKHFIWIKINKSLTGFENDLYCCGVYIPPVGSIYYTRHPDINLFELLNSDISQFSRLGDTMVTGDFNSHTGTKLDTLSENELFEHANFLAGQDALSIPPRSSMQAKVCAFGNDLLDVCFSHNMCILNGRHTFVDLYLDLEIYCTYIFLYIY